MNLKTRHILAVGSLLAFALVSAGCTSSGSSGTGSDFTDTATVSQTFPYSGELLNIDAGTAELVVVSGDSSEVKVDRQVTGATNNKAPEATESLDGDTLNLAVDCNGFALGCEGRFTVTVPNGVAVVAQNKNSQITVRDFTADLTVSAVNGNAILSQISSPTLELTGKDMEVVAKDLSAKTITTDTRNGDLDLTFADAPDQVTVSGHDGDVLLALPKAEYLVDVTTKSGKEDVSVEESDSGSHNVSVTTRNGDITITQAS